MKVGKTKTSLARDYAAYLVVTPEIPILSPKQHVRLQQVKHPLVADVHTKTRLQAMLFILTVVTLAGVVVGLVAGGLTILIFGKL